MALFVWFAAALRCSSCTARNSHSILAQLETLYGSRSEKILAWRRYFRGPYSTCRPQSQRSTAQSYADDGRTVDQIGIRDCAHCAGIIGLDPRPRRSDNCRRVAWGALPMHARLPIANFEFKATMRSRQILLDALLDW